MNTLLCPARRKAVWGPKIIALATLVLIAVGFAPSAMAANRNRQASSRHATRPPMARAGAANRNVRHYKIDPELTRRKGSSNQLVKVIVTLTPGSELPADLKRFVRRNRRLDLISGRELELPLSVVQQLEKRSDVVRVHYDRPVAAHNYRTGVTIGANAVRNQLGFSGSGVGVAVIDSGITSWHNDLTKGNSWKTYPYGNQRVSAFVDFVNGHTQPYDDNGHGSHVAGIILGNGYESGGQKSGVAPGASLIVLKVLDANGGGSIGNVIAAMNWIAVNRVQYNIRVVNLSIGARVTESYWTDPLTLAAKQLADLGITVVTAAGNFGKGTDGRQQYGSITAPGNAPWVLTVGASSTQGTTTRRDDVMASYSSAGPTKYDYLAKPDLVAPGTGTVSLAVPGSTLALTKASALSAGTFTSNAYLSLSGTSMAAPVVAGTVAAMLQANPTLTPNLIKAILQYTAQPYAGYKPLQQGAGFLNAYGAVRLARFYYNNAVGSTMPRQASWSRSVVWGNRLIAGGYLNPKANAWADNVVWGTNRTPANDNIVWGTLKVGSDDNIVWGTLDANGDNVVWGTGFGDNIVWGTTSADNVVWGTNFSDNVVWGTSGLDDNVVWGTDCGGGDCDNVVWGTNDSDNVVWGTSDYGDNIVWGTNGEDNIVWGSNGDDNIVWGSSDGSTPEVVFPDAVEATEADITSELNDESADLFDLVGGF
ncbi:MAG: S8 family peptidase [Vicinamibacterales bacterium]